MLRAGKQKSFNKSLRAYDAREPAGSGVAVPELTERPIGVVVGTWGP